MKKGYTERDIKGVMALYAWGSIVILDIDPWGDYVTAGLFAGGEISDTRKAVLHCDRSGETYFNKRGIKCYLSDFMRSNY